MMHNIHILSNGRLEMRHLRLVLAIAREGDVTRAARLLHRSQSAVSHQLIDLEKELKTRLFDRIGKKMAPTQSGTLMIAAARRMLSELADLETSLAASRADTRAKLRITTSCFTSYNWLPAALTQFGDKYPNVELDLVLEATRRAIPALAADEVDIAIVTEPPRDDTWEKQELITSENVTIVGPDHPVARRAKRNALRWGALHDCELLVYEISDEDLERLEKAVRESWRADNGRALAAPLKVRKIPLSSAILELVRAGRGVAVVDRWAVAGSLGRDLVALPMQPRARRTFYATWRRSNPRALPIRDLVNIIKTVSKRTIGH